MLFRQSPGWNENWRECERERRPRTRREPISDLRVPISNRRTRAPPSPGGLRVSRRGNRRKRNTQNIFLHSIILGFMAPAGGQKETQRRTDKWTFKWMRSLGSQGRSRLGGTLQSRVPTQSSPPKFKKYTYIYFCVFCFAFLHSRCFP